MLDDFALIHATTLRGRPGGRSPTGQPSLRERRQRQNRASKSAELT
jgi:hypothetical protein